MTTSGIALLLLFGVLLLCTLWSMGEDYPWLRKGLTWLFVALPVCLFLFAFIGTAMSMPWWGGLIWLGAVGLTLWFTILAYDKYGKY
jgi:hypothetical protein